MARPETEIAGHQTSFTAQPPHPSPTAIHVDVVPLRLHPAHPRREQHIFDRHDDIGHERGGIIVANAREHADDAFDAPHAHAASQQR